jgi:hypothetical protein
MTRGKVVASLICLLLFCAYLWRWYYLSNGVVLVSSQSPYIEHSSTIVVRKLPPDVPFWAVLLVSLRYDSLGHRCELYGYGSHTLKSAQTYFADSFNAGAAEVVWEKSGGATVYLNGVRALAMDNYGYWTAVK